MILEKAVTEKLPFIQEAACNIWLPNIWKHNPPFHHGLYKGNTSNNALRLLVKITKTCVNSLKPVLLNLISGVFMCQKESSCQRISSFKHTCPQDDVFSDKCVIIYFIYLMHFGNHFWHAQYILINHAHDFVKLVLAWVQKGNQLNTNRTHTDILPSVT